MNNNLTVTERVILAMISNTLFGVPIDLPDNVDWREVSLEANAQAVLPLVFYNNGLIPSNIQDEAQPDIMAGITNNMRVEWNHIEAGSLMDGGDIPYVILKGCASAYYYPEPILRSMGDVDFLVPTEYLGGVDEILKGNGFTPWNERHICHIVYRKQDIHFEVHFEPAVIPEGDVGDIIRTYFEDIYDTSREVKVGDSTLCLPDDFHHGLVMLLHTCNHLTGEGMGLRHLCDWAVFVNHLSSDSFRGLFEEKLKAVGLWRYAQLLCQLCIRYLGLPSQEWAMENVDDEFLYTMIKDIFSSGNFGVKDSNRYVQTMVILDKGKNGQYYSSMIKQLFMSMNKIIYMRWPIAQKVKIILPFGWFFYGSRYIVRIIMGKRKSFDVSRVISGAKERRDIYREFHLYET
jgi:hypothetical protein